MGFAMTHEEFMRRINDINNTKVEILGMYRNSTTNILVRCNNPKCKHEWYANPRSLLQGCGCKKCQNHSTPPTKKKKSHNQFVKEVNELHSEIEILGCYNGSHEKILVKCRVDGHEWSPSATSLLHKNMHGCPKCATRKNAENTRLTHEEFIQRFNNCGNNYVKIIGTYVGADEYIDCHCKICNKPFKSTPSRLLGGAGCTRCKASKGEKRIMNYLDINNIKYKFQKKYKGLVGVKGRSLSYDFYLSDINILIEYQGSFHDGSGRKYTKRNLDTQQEHDRRKREYATNNNIKLLEIWYYDFDNIETILKSCLSIN